MTKEKQVTIPADDVELDARLNISNLQQGATITHPHPLYGGNMFNYVVNAIRKAFTQSNYSTLRFNFRGTGISTGKHDNGKLEQQDFLNAYNFLENCLEKEKNIICSGYSFGSCVMFNALQNFNVDKNVILVSPPLNVMDFNVNQNSDVKHKYFILAGDNDEYCNLDYLDKFADKIDAKVTVIKNTTHFYTDKENEIISELTKCISIF